MSFVDVYLPEGVSGYPCVAAPRTKTTIMASFGGGERRNQDWQHPLHKYVLPEAVAREPEAISSLKDHWMATAGPFSSFAWRDPFDKATVLHKANEPDALVIDRLTETDQAVGTGDGFTDKFQLAKAYTRGPQTYVRPIYLPVLATVLIGFDGDLVDDSEYTVSRPGGVITFNEPPPNLTEITAGFLFDVEVRFESDDAFEGIVRTWQVGGFADITLIEVRPC